MSIKLYMKKTLAFSALALAAGVASAAVADGVLDFEGIPFTNFPANLNGYELNNTATFSPPGYGNLKWSDRFFVIEGTHYNERNAINEPSPGNGFVNGVVSGNYVAFSEGGNPVSFESLTAAEHFNLNSLYVASAWRTDMQVTITGYRAGTEVYSLTTDPLAHTASLLTLNWTDLDKVSFVSVLDTGTPLPGPVPGGYQFVLDDLNISPVPEPSIYALLFAGLGIIGVVARRRTT